METIQDFDNSEPEDDEYEEQLWKDFAAENFFKGYGDDEPEYTLDDIIDGQNIINIEPLK